jgi:hypothetical protein
VRRHEEVLASKAAALRAEYIIYVSGEEGTDV